MPLLLKNCGFSEAKYSVENSVASMSEGETFAIMPASDEYGYLYSVLRFIFSKRSGSAASFFPSPVLSTGEPSSFINSKCIFLAAGRVIGEFSPQSDAASGCRIKPSRSQSAIELFESRAKGIICSSVPISPLIAESFFSGLSYLVMQISLSLALVIAT